MVDQLVDAALIDNPTLAEALARIDEARASVSTSRAQGRPQVNVDGSVTQARQTVGVGTATTGTATTASLSPALSWELDLWGRVRETTKAARDRLDARTADAQDARLSLVSQIAGGTLSLRACNYSLAVRANDIASRSTELDVTRKRLSFGNVAPVEVANAQSNLASAETARISQEEECSREVDALVGTSGRDAATVRALLPEPSPDRRAELPTNPATVMPFARATNPSLPATVLLTQPSVVAAEREVAARWSEIGVARANRLPRIDLAAVLTGQWISALGSAVSYTWSAGPQVSAPILDGGAGAATVRRAEALYRESVATLRSTVRTAIQSVEDALAEQQSAEQRVVTSRQAVDAARVTLLANQARYRAGAISMFELEDSRRQYNSAQETAIAAARDRGQAWVDLVRATGNNIEFASSPAEGRGTLGSSFQSARPSR